MMQTWIEEAKARQPRMVTDRRILHQMPETGFDTVRTKEYVRKRLSEEGIEAADLGNNGLTAVIGKGEHCFLLRADMDALSVAEQNDLPFRAENGNGHVCGHDIHTAMLLAAAGMLKKHEAELPGQVKLMFQPAEELGAGAKDMIAAGLLENPHVEAAAALHVQSTMPVGRASYTPGPATSSIDTFQILIRGKGGHSSLPEKAVNPLDVASYIQLLLNSAVQREISCQEHAVLAVTQVVGCEALNAFPDTAKICGNTRCYSNAVREYLYRRIPEVAEGVCALFHASCEIEWIRTPLLEVDDGLGQLFAPAFAPVMDRGLEKSGKPLAGSEDFAYLSQHIPVFFGWVGAGFEENEALHNPRVIFDEDVMWRGAAVLAGMAERWLREKSVE